jgi:hypothetical protein
MTMDWVTTLGQRFTLMLTIAVGATVAILAFFAYRATREWQRSSQLAVERRAADTADLLATALTRDMRGAQEFVLASRDWRPFSIVDRRHGSGCGSICSLPVSGIILWLAEG